MAKITLDGYIRLLKRRDGFNPQGVKHRIENKGSKKVVFIEVQTGTYFGEDDIVELKTIIIDSK